MGERGHEIVARKFSCEYHLKNTLELYDELLGHGKAASVRLDQKIQESL